MYNMCVCNNSDIKILLFINNYQRYCPCLSIIVDNRNYEVHTKFLY